IVLGLLGEALNLFLYLTTENPQAGQQVLTQIPSLLINVYFMTLLLSSKSAAIFTEEYRAAVEQTPELRFPPSVLMRILLIMVVTFIVLLSIGLGVLLVKGLTLAL